MKNPNLLRSPRGKFIWRGHALTAWLPDLLSWARYPLETAIDGMCRFCDLQAAHQYRRAAQILTEEDLGNRDLFSSRVESAADWNKRREILLRAKQELQNLEAKF